MAFSAKYSFPRVLAALVILASIPSIYFAFRWALADISAYPVRYSIERWESQRNPVSLAKIEKAEADIDVALSWNDNNAEYYELKARILFYRAVQTESDDYLQYIRQALALHNTALLLRPNWPYSWANKSLMKAYLGEIDDDFSEAIEQAAKTGPWELSANLAVLEAGLLGWDQLTPELEALVLAATSRASEHGSNAVRVLLDRYEFRSFICSLLEPSSHQKKMCKETL
ncbi:hypothetical protein [Neptunomonas sp.]|uniref:hypothetical protein n=1 Tax=Neptunomonas sp. TaxID=1971898 RepID=UPI0025E7F080|nr:hypothetical protein [Neptunomonas sp.]